MFLNDYVYTNQYTCMPECNVTPGMHDCRVKQAQVMTSKTNGVKFVVVDLIVKDTNGVPFRYFIREGDKFQGQWSRFLDAFKLNHNTQPEQCTNAMGTCTFVQSTNSKDGKQYVNCIPFVEQSKQAPQEGNADGWPTF